MKIRNWILFLLLAALLCTTAFASEDRALLFDEADVLTDREESEVNGVLNRIYRRTDMDVMIVTLRDAEAGEYMANMQFAQKSLLDDGVILLLCFAEDGRTYYISARGEGENIFDDRAYDKVENACLPHLREDRFEEACIAYGEACEDVITSYGKLPVGGILVCILIGALLSFLIPMSILKRQLKTVRSQPGAASYIKKNSMDLTKSRDTFLYRNVSRVAKPQNNSGGSRSGGSSGGGGRGGSF